jgi:hypothetical protein
MQLEITVVPRAPRVRLRQAAVMCAGGAYLSAYGAAVLACLTIFAPTELATLWELGISGLLFSLALVLWRCDVRRDRRRPAAAVASLPAERRTPQH